MRQDVLLYEDFDVQTADGDFVTGESDQQHVELIALFQKAELREYPVVGFGVERFLKTVADRKKFTRELKVQLENDGYENTGIQLSDDLADFKVILNEQ